MLDTEEYVTCRICNGKYRNLTISHMKKIHGITNEEYRERYPDAKMVCGSTSKMISKNTLDWIKNNPEEAAARDAKAQEGYRKWERDHPEEAFAAQSLGGQRGAETMRSNPGKYLPIFKSNGDKLNQWKKDNPEESARIYRENLSAWRRNNPDLAREISAETGRKTMERRWSEDFEKERAIAATNLMTWMKDPKNEDAVRESKRMSMRSQARRVTLKENRFSIDEVRSGFEAMFVYRCQEDDNVLSCEYEPFWIRRTCGERRYLPDFLVNGVYLVEIKPVSRLNDEDTLEKEISAQVYCKDNNLQYRILNEEDLLKIRLEKILVSEYLEMMV